MIDPEQQLRGFRSTAFPSLRPLQADALTRIAEDYGASRDLALQMPTGSGKTLVGLLLAGQEMERGRAAVYLTGTIQLSRQVLEEANRLRMRADLITAPLSSVSALRIARIEAGETLAVLNYWAYFSERELVTPPGMLIVDDAHLLEGALESRYGISITEREDSELLLQIYELISSRYPGYQVIDDLALGGANPSHLQQLIAFPHVLGLTDAMHALLRDAAATTDRIRYPYQRIANRLQNCLWLAGPNEFLIRPLRYPLHEEARFDDVDRRLYMSATMGDLADLRRRLGTERIARVDLDTSLAAESGRRFIVLADTPEAGVELEEARPRLMAATPRRVWFCRSKYQAAEVAEWLSQGDRKRSCSIGKGSC